MVSQIILSVKLCGCELFIFMNYIFLLLSFCCKYVDEIVRQRPTARTDRMGAPLRGNGLASCYVHNTIQTERIERWVAPPKMRFI
jgi:hypothetical protein